MENRSVEEIIRMRAKNRLTKKQGVDFLREYRDHPEMFLPLIDHQYKHFDEWEDQESRNLCWDAGIFQDNCPYFAECWKIFTTTVMTVFISIKGIDWEPNLKNILVEFIPECLNRRSCRAESRGQAVRQLPVLRKDLLQT